MFVWLQRDCAIWQVLDPFEDFLGSTPIFVGRSSWSFVLFPNLICNREGISSGDNTALVGDWQGMLYIPNGNLPVIFHIGSDGSGSVDSPSQNFTASLQYSRNANIITLIIPSINSTFAATLNGNEISGAWLQNGRSTPLIVFKSTSLRNNGESPTTASSEAKHARARSFFPCHSERRPPPLGELTCQFWRF